MTTDNNHFHSLLVNAVSTGSKQVLAMPKAYVQIASAEKTSCINNWDEVPDCIEGALAPHCMVAGKLVKLHLSGADIRYISNFYSQLESLEMFEKLFKSVFLKSGPWDRFGKGRFVAQWSDPANLKYLFSGIEYTASAFPGFVRDISQDLVKLLSPIYGADRCAFNYCVGNYYADGFAGVNWHTDSEEHIVAGCPIACVSFGAERVFSLARMFNPNERINIRLESGSVIVMAGDTQSNYLHAISKERNKAGRFSLTFRVNYR